MGVVAGDIIEVTYNHPTLGSGVLFPKSAEDSKYDLGGFRSTDDANMVDGSGAMIDQKQRKRCFFEITAAWDANNREELEKMNALAEHPVPADWTITSVNKTVYGMKGIPVGDIEGNGNAGTFPLKVSGGGKMKKIVG